MTRAACYLGFFDFLRAGKFTTSLPFDLSIYLAVSNMQANTLVNPTWFKIQYRVREPTNAHKHAFFYL